MEDLTDHIPLEGGNQKWDIVRVGSEPLVLWEEGHDGLPRWSVVAPGWIFKRTQTLEFQDGAIISGTPIVDLEDFDLEHGELIVAGFTIADLRAVAHEHR